MNKLSTAEQTNTPPKTGSIASKYHSSVDSTTKSIGFSFTPATASTITFGTWNVNSLRARMEHVRRFLIEHAPDVLCLQETKLPDELFPQSTFEELGYHAVWWGEKSYNGVAILSKHPITNTNRELDNKQSRLISSTIKGIRVINGYFPQGRNIASEHFAYKLSFYKQLRETLERNHQPSQAMLLAGDFNIAPEPRDVYDPRAMENKISFHPQEREVLAQLSNWGWQDAFRLLHQEKGHHTWWDFRTAAWEKGHGLRLDHIWLTKPLAQQLLNCWIETQERTRFKPSDHVPVLAEIKYPPTASQ